jgi:hypothetical protein
MVASHSTAGEVSGFPEPRVARGRDGISKLQKRKTEKGAGPPPDTHQVHTQTSRWHGSSSINAHFRPVRCPPRRHPPPRIPSTSLGRCTSTRLSQSRRKPTSCISACRCGGTTGILGEWNPSYNAPRQFSDKGGGEPPA